jgi:hypothetical protein
MWNLLSYTSRCPQCQCRVDSFENYGLAVLAYPTPTANKGLTCDASEHQKCRDTSTIQSSIIENATTNSGRYEKNISQLQKKEYKNIVTDYLLEVFLHS